MTSNDDNTQNHDLNNQWDGISFLMCSTPE